jgi:hypothetical protein
VLEDKIIDSPFRKEDDSSKNRDGTFEQPLEVNKGNEW